MRTVKAATTTRGSCILEKSEEVCLQMQAA